MVYITLTTVAKKKDAERLARALLSAKAAACVSVLAGAKSFFRWKGKRREETEYILVIKTTKSALPRLRRVFKKNHPYEAPELVAWPAKEGNPLYLAWVEEECRQ